MSMTLKNDRFLRACRRESTDRTPVWMMRQAGRYLPEYRTVRQNADFMTMCQTPELAAEVTIQPIDRLGVDAAILFSDILVIPDAMGLELELIESRGPVFHKPLREVSAIRQLPVPDPDSDLGYVMEAIRLIQKRLDGRVPLIGFSGAPWTLMTYMVEGQSSKTFRFSKSLLLDEPAAAIDLLDRLSESVASYLLAQIRAGVQAVQIFDTWAGALPPHLYLEFGWPALESVIRALKPAGVPVIVFAKGADFVLERAIAAGATVFGADHSVPIGELASRTAGRIAVQGNLDPSVLYGSPDAIRREVNRLLTEWGGRPGHIFNLGHGIHPDVNPDHAKAMVEAVQAFRMKD